MHLSWILRPTIFMSDSLPCRMFNTVGFLIRVGNPSRPPDCVRSLVLKTILSELEYLIQVVVMDV
jgi:hypothetical protein